MSNNIPSRSERPRQTSFGGYTNRRTHLHVSEGTIKRAKDQHDPLQPLRASLGLISIEVSNGQPTRNTPKSLFT